MSSNSVVAGRYQINRYSSLGYGSFSRVYAGLDLETKKEVAVKVVTASRGAKQVQTEAKVLSKLQKPRKKYSDFPKLLWHGLFDGYHTEVLQCLGSSLLDLLLEGGRKFSLKTVLLLADQMLPTLESLHEEGYVHKDLKPDNLVMGRGEDENQLFLIDFGQAQPFLNNGVHIRLQKGKAFQGNVYWASSNLLRGLPASRRDDLEALMYVLIYLHKGELPWQVIRESRNRLQRILSLKDSMSTKDICHRLPTAFQTVLEYIRSLNFADAPDYAWIRAQFREAAVKLNICYDFKYDWKEKPIEKGAENSLPEMTDAFLDSGTEHFSENEPSMLLFPPDMSAREWSGSLTIVVNPPIFNPPPNSPPFKQMAAFNHRLIKPPGNLLELCRTASLVNSSGDQNRVKNTLSTSTILPRSLKIPCRTLSSFPQLEKSSDSPSMNTDHDETPKTHLPKMSPELRRRLKWDLLK